MITKPKSNSTITHEVDGSTITWTVLGAGSVALDLSRLSADVARRAMVHGMIQRVSDGAALSRQDPETGAIVPAEEFARMKLASMSRIVEHYMSGASEWNLRTGAVRESGGLLVAVLVEAYPNKTREALAAW